MSFEYVYVITRLNVIVTDRHIAAGSVALRAAVLHIVSLQCRYGLRAIGIAQIDDNHRLWFIGGRLGRRYGVAEGCGRDMLGTREIWRVRRVIYDAGMLLLLLLLLWLRVVYIQQQSWRVAIERLLFLLIQ